MIWRLVMGELNDEIDLVADSNRRGSNSRAVYPPVYVSDFCELCLETSLLRWGGAKIPPQKVYTLTVSFTGE